MVKCQKKHGIVPPIQFPSRHRPSPTPLGRRGFDSEFPQLSAQRPAFAGAGGKHGTAGLQGRRWEVGAGAGNC